MPAPQNPALLKKKKKKETPIKETYEALSKATPGGNRGEGAPADVLSTRKAAGYKNPPKAYPKREASAESKNPPKAYPDRSGPKPKSKDYPYNKPSTNTQLRQNAAQDPSHTRKPIPATAHDDKQAAWRRAQLTGQGDNWNARKGRVNRDGRH